MQMIQCIRYDMHGIEWIHTWPPDFHAVDFQLTNLAWFQFWRAVIWSTSCEIINLKNPWSETSLARKFCWLHFFLQPGLGSLSSHRGTWRGGVYTLSGLSFRSLCPHSIDHTSDNDKRFLCKFFKYSLVSHFWK